MEYLTDVKVAKVYKGASGEGQYGPWQILNLYFEGKDEKFSWFEDSERNPVPGDALKIVGYEVSTKEKEGKTYTNYNIKQLEFAQAQTPVATQTPAAQQKSSSAPDNITMYVSYVKDVVVAKIGKGEEITTNQAVDLIAKESKRLYDLVEGGAPKQTEAPRHDNPYPTYEPPPMDEDSDIPF